MRRHAPAGVEIGVDQRRQGRGCFGCWVDGHAEFGQHRKVRPEAGGDDVQLLPIGRDAEERAVRDHQPQQRFMLLEAPDADHRHASRIPGGDAAHQPSDISSLARVVQVSAGVERLTGKVSYVSADRLVDQATEARARDTE